MVVGGYQLGSNICNRLGVGSVLSRHVKLSLEVSSSGAQRPIFSCVNTQNPTKPKSAHHNTHLSPTLAKKTEKCSRISRHHNLEMV